MKGTEQRLRERMPGPQSEFIAALAEELPARREPTTGLVPSIYVAGDFHQAADTLGATARHVVGSGVVEPGAVRGMLRLCAPLARDGWHMLCEVMDDRLRYGVIAREDDGSPSRFPPGAWCPANVKVASIAGGIRIWEPDQGIVAIGMKPNETGHNGDPDATLADRSPLNRLIAATVERVDEAEGARAHLAHLFDQALAKPTGALVAVAPPTWTGGWPCEDATVLREPIDLPRMAAKVVAEGVSQLALTRYEALAASMIREDGIAVFDEAARLRAYRWFVPFTPNGVQSPGGARERAFRALEDLVACGALCAAFIQSSDGTMGFVNSETAGVG